MTLQLPEFMPLIFQIGLATLVGLISFPLAGTAAKAVRRVVGKSKRIAALDATLVNFVAELVRIGFLVCALLLVLALAGVQSSSIVAVLGAATLAIGLAMQATLANVAAGVLIFVLAPFRVGEAVEIVGRQGQIKLLSLFTTELESLQGSVIILANAQIMLHPITNFTRLRKARVDLDVILDWDSDTDTALALAKSVATDLPNLLPDLPPEALISGLSHKGPTLSLRLWTLPHLRVEMRSAAAASLHKTLRANGFSGAKPE
ncbi:MAG: MscS mechanosensitive ion channel [Pseudomonadota bacterium]